MKFVRTFFPEMKYIEHEGVNEQALRKSLLVFDFDKKSKGLSQNKLRSPPFKVTFFAYLSTRSTAIFIKLTVKITYLYLLETKRD